MTRSTLEAAAFVLIILALIGCQIYIANSDRAEWEAFSKANGCKRVYTLGGASMPEVLGVKHVWMCRGGRVYLR